jgi:hypothetical protein
MDRGIAKLKMNVRYAGLNRMHLKEMRGRIVEFRSDEVAAKVSFTDKHGDFHSEEWVGVRFLEPDNFPFDAAIDELTRKISQLNEDINDNLSQISSINVTIQVQKAQRDKYAEAVKTLKAL